MPRIPQPLLGGSPNAPRPGAAPVIVSARRTPIGTVGHAFSKLTTTDLVAPLLADAADLLGGLGRIDDVILGNCMGPGGDIARVAALAAGLGPAIPAVTLDRQCGSGLDAVLQAGSRILAGDAGVVLAGGVESASTAPWRFWPPQSVPKTANSAAMSAAAPRERETVPSAGSDSSRIGSGVRARLVDSHVLATDRIEPGARYTRAPFTPPGFPDPSMGAGAEELARHLGISRQRQDDYAARSHQLSFASVHAGTFDSEILAIQGISTDERPRAGMTAQRLSRLRPAFEGFDGNPITEVGGYVNTVTAGNSCGISDGAAVLTLVHPDLLGDVVATPRISLLAGTVAGCDPAMPGLAIEPAVRKLLAHPRVRSRGIEIADIGAIEITEAFASVALAAIDTLNLDLDRVCSQGGAIGLGHPWGASGAVLLVRLATRMLAPDGPELGLAACAVGGGQAVAVLVEKT